MKIARLHNDGRLFIKGKVIEKDKEIIIPHLEFDGSGSVTVPHNNIFNITDAITISARIKLTDNNDYGQFMTKGNAFASFLAVRESDGFTVWYSKMNGGVDSNFWIGYFQELIDGNWHNVVFSYDKDAGENNQRLYIDGVLKAQKTTAGVFDTTTNPLNLVTSSFKGGFRDARIYDRQLTDNEVVDLFEEKSVTEGLIGHWKINEGVGNIAYDSSPNSNNGSIVGALWKEDIERVDKTSQLTTNGDLIVYGQLVEKEIVPPSLSFNNDYLDLPLINSVRSIMMKIKIPTQPTERWGYVVDARDGLSAGYIGTGGAGRDFVKMYIDGNLAPNVSWANIPKDKWISLYIEAGSNFNDDINIFSRSGSIRSQGAVGELREVQIWNKALSQEEIITYGEGVSGEEEGLLAYYPVTSTTSDTLIDVVNNYNGQISPRVILKKDNALRLISNSPLEVVEIVEGAGDILVHRYIHQGNKVIQPTGLNKTTGLFTTTEPITLAPGTKRQVITAFNYQTDGSIPREWKGVDGHYIDIVSSTSFYIRGGSANGEILTYTNTNNNLVDVNSFRFEYDFQGNYQVDLSGYNIKKGRFNFKGTRHRPGWSYIYMNVTHEEGSHQHNFGVFADGRDYLTLDVTGLLSIEDNLVSARIKEFTKTEWNDSNGTWVNFQGSGGNVLNQSFDNPSFGILNFSYAMANGSIIEIYDIEHSLE